MEEEGSNLLSRVVQFLRANIFISALFFIGLIFLVIGLIQFIGRSENESIEFESGQDVKASETTSQVYIDISGEVVKPGVYELDPDSRIQDAIDKAGGLNNEADSEYISKSLNLAQKLTDGMKIYIPAVGEAPPAQIFSSESNRQGLISINSSSQQDLETLPAVGPVTAQKIIDLRPYGSFQELIDKKAVGRSTFEKIKDLISL